MKNKKLLIITLVALIVVVALVGCKPNSDDDNYGIYAIYGIDTEKLTQEELDNLDSLLEDAKDQLQAYAIDNGYPDTKVFVIDKKIRIEIPNAYVYDGVFKPTITSYDVEFKEYIDGSDGDLSLDDPNGRVKLNSKFTGTDVVSVAVIYDEEAKYYKLSFKFSEEGSEKFSVATTALSGERMSIWVDGKLVDAPYVTSAITDGIAELSPKYTHQDAWDLAKKIQFCSFPVKLELQKAGVLTAPTSGEMNDQKANND